jgi:4'-phosphopantetheinyl transferase
MLQVAVAPIDETGDVAAPVWLGASEWARWATLSPSARLAWVESRRLLRSLLRMWSGAADDAWTISADAGTAPIVRGPHSVSASISHRLGWVAAAVSDAAVGVDVEVLRPPRSDASERAALMLAPAELEEWNALPAERREPALLTAWTAKEAWFKAVGDGGAPWDFRKVIARSCAPAGANVRTWSAPPLHVAVCSASADDLAHAECAGIDPAAPGRYWRVAGA